MTQTDRDRIRQDRLESDADRHPDLFARSGGVCQQCGLVDARWACFIPGDNEPTLALCPICYLTSLAVRGSQDRADRYAARDRIASLTQDLHVLYNSLPKGYPHVGYANDA